MLCSDIMTKELAIVTPSDTIATAARVMRDANIGFLPVCDPDQVVLGVLTDRDLAVRAVAGAKPAETPVSAVMSRDVVCCRPGDELEVAERLMRTRRKARMMCTDAELKLCGIISLSDLAQHETARSISLLLRHLSARETTTLLDVDLDELDFADR